MTETATRSIFISCAVADSQRAAVRLRLLLSGMEHALGANAVSWEDLNAHRDDHCRERLGKAMTAADRLLVVVSPNWLRSEFALWDCEVARQQGARICPVVIHPGSSDVSVPAWLTREAACEINLESTLSEQPDWLRLCEALGVATDPQAVDCLIGGAGDDVLIGGSDDFAYGLIDDVRDVPRVGQGAEHTGAVPTWLPQFSLLCGSLRAIDDTGDTGAASGRIPQQAEPGAVSGPLVTRSTANRRLMALDGGHLRNLVVSTIFEDINQQIQSRSPDRPEIDAVIQHAYNAVRTVLWSYRRDEDLRSKTDTTKNQPPRDGQSDASTLAADVRAKMHALELSLRAAAAAPPDVRAAVVADPEFRHVGKAFAAASAALTTLTSSGPDRPLTLPKKAPTLFKGKRIDGDPVAYAAKHYGPWLAAKLLDLPALGKLDRKLKIALDNEAYAHGRDQEVKDLFPRVTMARDTRAGIAAPVDMKAAWRQQKRKPKAPASRV